MLHIFALCPAPIEPHKIDLLPIISNRFLTSLYVVSSPPIINFEPVCRRRGTFGEKVLDEKYSDRKIFLKLSILTTVRVLLTSEYLKKQTPIWGILCQKYYDMNRQQMPNYVNVKVNVGKWTHKQWLVT